MHQKSISKCFPTFVFQSSTETTITIRIYEPTDPNGHIEAYRVYVDGIEVCDRFSGL